MSNTMPIYTDFFTSGKGLTSTSANHLANIAKEAYTADTEFLRSCNFLNEYISVLGTNDKEQLVNGMTVEQLNTIKDKLDRIASLKGFCAWVREAIKEKERYVSWFKINNTFDKWCIANNVNCPDMPTSPGNACATYKYEMSVADKAEMLYVEAAAATYGEFIHPSGSGNKAYATLVKRVYNPKEVNENGRDTIVREFVPSINPDTVKESFDALRDTWRSYEAELNKFKHTEKDKDAEYNTKSQTEYAAAIKAYQLQIDALQTEYKVWYNAEVKRISELRIVIPHKLEGIFQELSALGKEK